MKKRNHIRNYLKFFGYGEQSFIPSEISGKPAVDPHHIIFRSAGGGDNIENLIGLTRDEHDQAHGRKLPKLSAEYLQKKHNEFIRNHRAF